MVKFVYAFEEGNKEMKSELGGKGAGLAEMKKIGLPVPDGFTISTKACMNYYENNKKISEDMKEQIESYLSDLETKTGKTLGGKNPLLVSVRSGAVISMPGMMDTILNLGLNDETVEILAENSDPVFAFDAYRRLIQMFADVVLGIEKYKFDKIYQRFKEKNVVNLRKIVEEFKGVVLKETRSPFPQDAKEQMYQAINAVFESWNNHRAIVYRKINQIPDDLGTAVNIQEMVFGNTGERSGTGVAFTRNPSTGENGVYGEYLLNAQGEDVVAGIRTPKHISTLEESLPEVFKQFIDVTDVLEAHYKDMQDIEFTIENGKLFLLQTRTGKRTAQAAIRIAVDMVKEGVIDKTTAIMRVEPNQIHQLLHPTFSEESKGKAKALAEGLPASPGAASGKIYFDANRVKEAVLSGEKAILVRTETSPEDIEGMIHAEGILTSRGGMTSHAAVVARGMGKCCIAGCHDVVVSSDHTQMIIDDRTFVEGDEISLDGTAGIVYDGIIETADASLSEEFNTLMAWADEKRILRVRANADTVHDASIALKFGAEGIGLCRTEHMFFDPSRIMDMRRMILAEYKEDRLKALDKLMPYQQKDFYGLFKLMKNLPITIRLLDPPLHEFLPHTDEEISVLADMVKKPMGAIKERIKNLEEVNPMLGHRGCRLGITYPEIYEMQVKAIFNAVCDLQDEGMTIEPEIMIPLVGFTKELSLMKTLVIETAHKVLEERNHTCTFTVGTMIEVPRAALTADEIAKEAEFFSFGTNDLTQMTLGFSRDDSSKFIHEYVNHKVFDVDPFESVDQTGVGRLMEIAVNSGRSFKADMKMGICGEHGGEPNSIHFCHKIGLNYVSCSPYRIPIAKLAAAQAALK
ncbi:pyruvate, phosphate dikinase [Acidaminobacter sp. JC074]|uniref:pyruvate, phosphate dikinase n=1 Tax=Acidaminobacter sp. JC074 TaxID=2530199 RepID=UPI001F10AB56|nr:pyruvate, phosphate dikinase [Acidaminobacter sp. JC074]MCH4887705.1 pyruvate, phosphate dikinase [Acidaminobacter sp. JC074]